MIAATLAFFIIWEVIAIFVYRSRGEEEKAAKSTNLTMWFVVALVVVLIISTMLTQSTGLEQGYAY